MRRVRDAGTVAMIGAMCAILAATVWCMPSYLQPPIEVISSKVVRIDLQHDRMTTETQFVFNHYCDGELSGWVRSTGHEPPPREWAAIGIVPLPPPGFMTDTPEAPRDNARKIARGEIVTRRVSIPLDGYVPEDGSLYLAERSFHCNLLQRIFPFIVKAPLAVIKIDTAG